MLTPVLFCRPQVIQALGTAIYKALDFGLSEHEEPHLSPSLESLIEFLTADRADVDEGIDIERDLDPDLDADSPGRDLPVFKDIQRVGQGYCL